MSELLKKSIQRVLGIMAFITISAGPTMADELFRKPPELSALIAEGLENNPGILSLESEISALMEDAVFAGSLEDPQLGIGLLNLPTDSFRLNQEAMTQKQLFISQKIPWVGKLSLRSRRAVLNAQQKESILSAKRLALSKMIATDYYELGFVAASQKINQRLVGTLQQLLGVSETKYASGQGLQQDVLQAQVELSKLIDEKIELAKKRRTLEERINGLLGREAFAPIDPPKNPGYTEPVPDADKLKDRALAQNPRLLARKLEADRAETEIALAKKEYFPDMNFKIAYSQRDESQTGQDRADFVSASVTINLPVWRNTRQDKKLASSKTRHTSALQSYREMARRLPFEIDAMVNEIESLNENYKLYADALLVQAEQWAYASLAAYRVGKLEFNTMLSAQIRLLRFENTANRYLFGIHQKIAALEEILGGLKENAQ